MMQCGDSIDFVCPRDHTAMIERSGAYFCQRDHRYPIVDGIPIFVLREATQTHPEAVRALDEAEAARELIYDDGATPAPNVLHPVVRAVLGATSGNLYYPIRNRIAHYPIPEIRVPAARQGETFLDIGCNWGRWCIAAAGRGYRVIGIDPSFGALVVARHVFRQLGVNVVLACADARYLPFKPDTFDVVYSYSVVQHFSKEDAQVTLAEIGRVLKSSGKSIIQMPNALGLRSLYHQVRRGFRKPRQFEVRYWTPWEIRRTFSEQIGATRIAIDGFFGLGIQAADIQDFLFHHRLVVRASELLRHRAKLLMPFADSLLVQSTKAASQGPCD